MCVVTVCPDHVKVVNRKRCLQSYSHTHPFFALGLLVARSYCYHRLISLELHTSCRSRLPESVQCNVIVTYGTHLNTCR